MALQIRRGLEVERFNPNTQTGPVFAEGELVYITDTDRLYVGDGSTQGGLLVASEALSRLSSLLTADTIGIGASGNVLLETNLDLNSHNLIGIGNIDIDGTIRATGNINLGDNASQDTVTLGAEVDSNITPRTDEAYDIGNANKRWRNGHFAGLSVTGTVDAIAVNGNIVSDDSTLLVNTATNKVFGDIVATPRLEGDAGTLTIATDVTVAEEAEFQKDVTVNTQITSPSFIGALTGNVTGNVSGNVTGDVTGTVSDISNHDTDALSEGATNLYYTDARADARIAAASITDLSDADQSVQTTDSPTFVAVTANLTGDVTGNVTGNVTGDVTGNTAGTHTGPVIGNVTGSVTGGVTGSVTGDLEGSVFAQDSTLLVDGVDGSIPGGVIKGALTDNDITGDLYSRSNGALIVDTSATTAIFNGNVTGVLTGNVNSTGTSSFNAVNVTTVINTADLDATGAITATGGFTGDIAGDLTGNLVATTTEAQDIESTGTISANTVLANTIRGTFDGDIEGSVFAEDSTILVDANNRTGNFDRVILSSYTLSGSDITATQATGVINLRNEDATRGVRLSFVDSETAEFINVNGITTGAESTSLGFDIQRGTIAAPNVVNQGDVLASINFNAYDGSDYTFAGALAAFVDPNRAVSVGDVPGVISLQPISGGAITGVGFSVDSTGSATLNRPYTAQAQATMDINGTLMLEPQTSAPTAVAGTFAVADASNWDPASKGGSTPYPVFYDGSAWNALY
jgi:hypothetical protein